MNASLPRLQPKTLWPLTLALAAVIWFPQPLAAQELELTPPAARQGYFIGGGVTSVFNSNFRTTDDDTGNLTGGAGHVRLGQMTTDWLGFGLQIGGGGASAGNFSTGYGGLMLDVQLVPFDHLGIHLGVGAGGLSLTDTESDSDELEGTGGGYYSVGLTYDWFPFYDSGSGGLSVTPIAQFQYMPGTIFDATMLTFGLEILWWSGLPNNKLLFPDGEGYEAQD